MPKVINDPVHGFITIPSGIIMDIISHPLFQRLLNIKQMGMAYLVYPGAVHNRFLHSLGAFHLIQLVLQDFSVKNIEISNEEKEAVQLAILLHDIGHFPFSHALEKSSLTTFHHEEMTLLIMNQLNIEFNGKLSLCIEIFKNAYSKKFLHQLISSHLDVDRMDYILRDSFFSGVVEGTIGSDRLIKMLNIEDDELVLEEKGLHSIDKFLVARRLMYNQVYFHKTVIASEKLLQKILERAKELYNTNVHLYLSEPMIFFFENSIFNSKEIKAECLKQFLVLDDNELLFHFKEWCKSEDIILSTLCKSVLNRKLYKMKETMDAKFKSDLILNLENRLGIPISDDIEHYFIFETEISLDFYNTKKESINIIKKNRQIKKLEQFENSIAKSILNDDLKRCLIYYFD